MDDRQSLKEDLDKARREVARWPAWRVELDDAMEKSLESPVRKYAGPMQEYCKADEDTSKPKS